MLKAAIKHGAGADQVRHRIVPADAVAKWSSKLEALKSEIAEVMEEEKQEKQVRIFFWEQLSGTHLGYRSAEWRCNSRKDKT